MMKEIKIRTEHRAEARAAFTQAIDVWDSQIAKDPEYLTNNPGIKDDYATAKGMLAL